MSVYNKQTTCGELIVTIEKKDSKYELKARMKKFGDCSAYTFISKFIEEKLNYEKDINEVIKELKKYKCKIGPSGCIEAIGSCIQKFKEDK